MGKRASSKELIDLGNRVRKWRTEAGMSQELLAERAEISLNTVSRIEGGQAAMSVTTFHKLTEVFGVDANMLLGDVEPSEEGENWKLRGMFNRVCHLEEGEQEVVAQTVEALVDGLEKIR